MTTDTPASPVARTALKGSKIGVVASDKRDKTRTVVVLHRFTHPKYRKQVMRSTRYQVHDQANEARINDRVEIVPCRPISKTKSWRLLRVLEKAPEVVALKP